MDDVVRVLVALIVSSAIGAEREYRSKAAGLRTVAPICVGSAVFTILSPHAACRPARRRTARTRP